MSNTFIAAVSVTLTTVECPECAGTYAISKQYQDEAREKGGFKLCWTCPYCKTTRGYGESDKDRLNKRLEEKERALTAAACREANERAAKELAERKLKRTCARVKAGVCPCCNRTVKQLASHMATKHPTYKA